jgi:hypothetical protein
MANKTGKQTQSGKYLNPIANKVFTLMMILPLIIYHGLPPIFIFLFIGREVLIIIGNIILKAMNKQKLILQNIWEKLSMFFLVILYLFIAGEYVIPMSAQLPLVLILLNLLLLYFSIVHYLSRLLIVIFRKVTILKVLLPILVILGFILFLSLWAYSYYFDTKMSREFHNNNPINTPVTDLMDKPPSESWQNASPEDEVLVLGPALGRMTDESVLIFILTQEEQTLNAIIYQDENHNNQLAMETIQTYKEDGFTGSVIINGLEPETYYYYDIMQNEESVVPDYLKPYCMFKTFPEDGDSFEEMRFMVTSGHKPLDTSVDDYYRSPIYPPQFRMWEALSRHIQQEHFDFLLLIGDQAYNDAPYEDTLPDDEQFQLIQSDKQYRKLHQKTVRDAYRKNYIRFWNHPSIKKVMASTPSFMIWDDHEFKDGWGSNKEDSTDPKVIYMKEQHIKVYEEYQNVFNPQPFNDDGKSWHFSFNFGDTAFFVPDLRGHRDINKSIDDFPLMGEKQWIDYDNWIKDEETLNKKAIFLGLSVPLVAVPNWITKWLSNIKGDLADDMKDRWFFWKNRPEMIRMIDTLFEYQEKSGNPAYPMGGDIHVSLLSRIINKESRTDNPDDDIIYEFSSSGIANEDPSTQASYAIFKQIMGDNEISNDYYSQVLKIVHVLNYGVVEVNRLDNGDYDFRYYVGYEIPNTPDSILYRLMYSSNIESNFPRQDIVHKLFTSNTGDE